MTDQDAQITLSVRQILERIEKRLIEVADSMAVKADRHEVDALDQRLRALEVETVRRDGPIIDEIHGFESKLDILRAALRDVQATSATEEQVKSALLQQSNALQSDRRQRWSFGERALALLIACVAAAGPIIAVAIR